MKGDERVELGEERLHLSLIVVRSVDLKDDEEYQLITVKRRNEGIVQRTRAVGKDILVKNWTKLLTGSSSLARSPTILRESMLAPSVIFLPGRMSPWRYPSF